MKGNMRGLLLRESGNEKRKSYAGNRLEDAAAYLEYGTLPIPEPGPGQVLIKVRRAAVNPSDIAFVQGYYGQERIKGRPAGFEAVGTVVGAGPGLLGRFLKGRDVSFYVTTLGSGAWAEYAVTDAAVVLPLKKGVCDKDAAGLLVNPVTAAAMLELVRPGDAFVFSAAASQLGKLIASLAKDQGKKMIAIARREEPLKVLRNLGAAYTLNEAEAGFSQELADVLTKEAPMVFLDAVAGSVSARVHHAMGAKVRWVIYGKLDATPTEILDPAAMIFQRKSIEGFWLSTWANETSFLRKLRVFDAVQKRFRDERWSTDVSAEIPIEHAIEQLPLALAQPDGKVQIITSSG